MVCSFQDVPIVTGDNFLQAHALDEPMRFGTRIDQYQAHRSNEGLVTLCANEQVPMVLQAKAVLVTTWQLLIHSCSYIMTLCAIAHSSLSSMVKISFPPCECALCGLRAR